MSNKNNAEEIFNILKQMYQEMVKNKNCKICRFHTCVPVLQGLKTCSMDFCKKKMCNCHDCLSCNGFEVIQ